MDKQGDKHEERMLGILHELFPKVEMHQLLDDLAARRLPCTEFKTFVWHNMAKAAAEQVAGRRWELVEGDVRHAATQMAVIYTMHCVYERAAKGSPDIACPDLDCSIEEPKDLWTWGYKAG